LWPSQGSEDGWIVRPHPCPSISGAASVTMDASVPLPLFFFVATMAVNHDQGKKDAKACQKNAYHWIVCPYPAEKSLCVFIHK
jgi:hypothetical protein